MSANTTEKTNSVITIEDIEDAIETLETYDMTEDNEDEDFKEAVALALKALKAQLLISKMADDMEEYDDKENGTFSWKLVTEIILQAWIGGLPSDFQYIREGAIND